MSFSQWDDIHNKLIKDAERSISRRSHRKTELQSSNDPTQPQRQENNTLLYFLVFVLVVVSIAGVVMFYIAYYVPLPSEFKTGSPPKKSLTTQSTDHSKKKGIFTPDQEIHYQETSTLESRTSADSLTEEISGQSNQKSPLERALELYKKGHLKEAINMLKDLLQKGNQKARLPLARALRDLNSAECIPYFMAEVELADTDTELLYEAGHAMIDLGAYEQAMSCAQKILALNPSSLNGLELAALTEQNRENWEEASEYLQKMLALVPDSIDIRYQLAEVLEKTGNFKKALEEYETLEGLAKNRKERQRVREKIEELKKIIGEVKAESQSNTTDKNDSPEAVDENSAYDDNSQSDAIPLTQIGGNFFVPVVVNDALEISLVLDTGASMTVLGPDLASQLGIDTDDIVEYIPLQTAGGLINAPVVYIQKIQIGQFYIENSKVALNQNFSGEGIPGLLGTDFLNNFRFSIDTVDQVLYLEVVQY